MGLNISRWRGWEIFRIRSNQIWSWKWHRRRSRRSWSNCFSPSSIQKLIKPRWRKTTNGT